MFLMKRCREKDVRKSGTGSGRIIDSRHKNTGYAGIALLCKGGNVIMIYESPGVRGQSEYTYWDTKRNCRFRFHADKLMGGEQTEKVKVWGTQSG